MKRGLTKMPMRTGKSDALEKPLFDPSRAFNRCGVLAREVVLLALSEFLLPLSMRTRPYNCLLGPDPSNGSPKWKILEFATQHRRALTSRIRKWPPSFQRHVSHP